VNPNPWVPSPKTRVCYGCGGRGWVETSKGAQRCPICNGVGVIRVPKKDITWRWWEIFPYRNYNPYIKG